MSEFENSQYIIFFQMFEPIFFKNCYYWHLQIFEQYDAATRRNDEMRDAKKEEEKRKIPAQNKPQGTLYYSKQYH